MSDEELRERLDSLRTGTPSYDDLEALWADCPPVRAGDVLGWWAGSDFGPGHPVHEMLATSGWHGKRFESTRPSSTTSSGSTTTPCSAS